MNAAPAMPETAPGFDDAAAEQAVEALERLAGDSLPSEAFYPRWLESVCVACGGVTAARWHAVDGAPGVRPAERYRAMLESRPNDAAADPAPIAEVAAGGAPRMWRDRHTNTWRLAAPVRDASRVVGVVVIEVGEGRSQADAMRTLEFVTAASEIASRHEVGVQAQRVATQAEVVGRHDAALLRLQTVARNRDAAQAIADAVATDGLRVTALVGRGRLWHVAAVSAVAKADRRSDTLRTIKRVVDACAGDGGFAYTGGRLFELDAEGGCALSQDLDAAPPVAKAWDDWAGASEATSAWLMPYGTGDANNEPCVTLFVERFDGPFEETLPRRCAPLARHAAAAVTRIQSAGLRGVTHRALDRLRRRAVAAALATAVLAVVAFVLFGVKGDLEVSAEGRFVPVDRARVFAPRDAVVEEVLVEHGARVSAGDPLVSMRCPDLEIEIAQLEESLALGEQDRAAMRAARLRGAPGVTAADREAAAARLKALDEQLKIQRERHELLIAERERLLLRSPIDGEITSWRPESYLAGRTVLRGQRLMEVAASGGDWRIEIDLPDHKAGPVLSATAQALPVRYVANSSPGDERRAVVTAVAGATHVDADGRPIVRVEASPEGIDPRAIRSGARVAARIDCGKRILATVWFNDAYNALQLWWF